MSSGVAQFYETMSYMRTTKQNAKHNKAELDVTRKWIISQGIPSRGKAVKPIDGVVNDCRTLPSMKALMVRQQVITIHEGLCIDGVRSRRCSYPSTEQISFTQPIILQLSTCFQGDRRVKANNGHALVNN